jgi:hypothetical protein
VTVPAEITEAGRTDAGAFLHRLLRLDPAAVVRLRPAADGVAEMWARVPFGVLVVRRVAAVVGSDTTVDAAALMNTLSDRSAGAAVRRRDEAWHWPLPPARARVVERIPVAEVARVAVAASQALRVAVTEGVGGRPVGERMVRDALLDHVPIVVTGVDGERVEVPQRLVQALVRMGFVSNIENRVALGETLVTVRWAAGWIGLDGSYGSAWYRPISALRFV